MFPTIISDNATSYRGLSSIILRVLCKSDLLEENRKDKNNEFKQLTYEDIDDIYLLLTRDWVCLMFVGIENDILLKCD